MAEVRAWAVVPAAGIGSRMGGELPKQYLPIAGKSVLELTLEKVLAWTFLSGVVVALRLDDEHFAGLSLAAHKKISRCAGGPRRSDSVLACLGALAVRAHPDDWVLVHDAARPCVRAAQVESLYTLLNQGDGGGLLALPVAETIKRADASDQVLTTVERDGLWLAQTPQMFRYKTLKDALETARAGAVQVTDEAAAVERCGGTVKLVAGHGSNIKITGPQDLELARMWLRAEGVI